MSEISLSYNDADTVRLLIRLALDFRSIEVRQLESHVAIPGHQWADLRETLSVLAADDIANLFSAISFQMNTEANEPPI